MDVIVPERKIEHLVFDLYEVLLNGFMDLPEKIYREIIQRDPSFDFEGFNDIVYSSFFITEDDNFGLWFRGKRSEREFFSRFLQGTKYSLTVEDLENLTRENIRELDHSREIIKNLYLNNYHLVLLSDQVRELAEYTEDKFQFMSYFDETIYSFESGLVKSDPGAFENMVKITGIDPRKTVFIDDMPGNHPPARRAGIKYTHIFRGPERLKRDLAELGVRGF